MKLPPFVEIDFYYKKTYYRLSLREDGKGGIVTDPGGRRPQIVLMNAKPCHVLAWLHENKIPTDSFQIVFP